MQRTYKVIKTKNKNMLTIPVWSKFVAGEIIHINELAGLLIASPVGRVPPLEPAQLERDLRQLLIDVIQPTLRLSDAELKGVLSSLLQTLH